MTISSLTTETIAEYLRIAPETLTTSDIKMIEALKQSAISFITSYTGRQYVELLPHEDITFAALILISDGWDNRRLYIDSNNVNKIVSDILGMYSVNLL